MRFEYLISADFPSRDAVDAILRTATGAVAVERARRFDFRHPGAAGRREDERPDASAFIEDAGIRFCTYTHAGICAEVFGFIVSSAACFGEVRVTEIG